MGFIMRISIAAESGVKHLDLRFGCGALSRTLGTPEITIIDQFEKSLIRAENLGLDVCPTLCFSRHETMERAHYLKDFVLEHREVIRAIDLEGPEAPNPTRSFAPLFKDLKDAGLHVTVHAGEFAPAQTIWEAIDSCGAERLGHAFTAPTDAALLKRLASDKIPVEVCLSSNYLLGLCENLDRHPFIQMIEAGVPVVLCTDDQAMFKTTLAQEYERAAAVLSKVTSESQAIIETISANSRKFAFLGPVI